MVRARPVARVAAAARAATSGRGESMVKRMGVRLLVVRGGAREADGTGDPARVKSATADCDEF
ncbi:hypothetical protein Kpho02_49960 [Kitasatospora phosalacinea]|uniref:Uncharacterized protein n=1 Tax=Kitasatospora phosalacinea TaxID=2065 RepID=A0A9W6Q9M5_9ACTN|nr:hypothetical protein Kpho02_49960 [Kitasatospora phosalacinea]